MDITLMFLAHVKMVRTTNKSLGIIDKKPSTNILKSKKDGNLAKAKEVVRQLTHLRQFLIDNKAAYLNIMNYLSTNRTMTEIDREQVESVAEDIVHKCKSIINDYKKEIATLKKTEQVEEHYNAVIESLEKYLREVSKVYTEAKAIRVKRVIEVHNLSKLGPTKRKTDERNDLFHSASDDEDATQVKKVIIPEVLNIPNVEEELSSEEMQMFQAENDTLYNELNSMSDEVKQMESKIVHIAELQELFSEKVLQQEGDIDRIANVVVGSTEQIKDANEQIRQAIQRKAGLRAWVLFFLLVMSFSLLFLDWYND
ncbi:syntaxin-18 [Coccinella septempunctata]|uniref:syntaxin-18 n=1 Tax=Coccinella septempunctata TaxID=41139 RepID=UPI001D089EA6|nr:syntaxin-18 [Coccinella septempunctata]